MITNPHTANIRAVQEEAAVTELRRSADAMTAAGIGLRTLGLLLSEADLSREDFNGLCHAVAALGALVDSNARQAYAFADQRLPGGDK